MTITKEVTRTITAEIEVPAFFMKGRSFYKVEGHDTAIEFSLWENINAMSIQRIKSEARVNNICSYLQISEVDFNKNLMTAMQLANTIANDLLNKSEQLEMEHSYLLTNKELHNGQSGC